MALRRSPVRSRHAPLPFRACIRKDAGLFAFGASCRRAVSPSLSPSLVTERALRARVDAVQVLLQLSAAQDGMKRLAATGVLATLQQALR
jgi:hypothetical protein